MIVGCSCSIFIREYYNFFPVALTVSIKKRKLEFQAAPPRIPMVFISFSKNYLMAAVATHHDETRLLSSSSFGQCGRRR
jgi:hypothetical protein